MKNAIMILLVLTIVLFSACGNSVSGPQQRLEELKLEYDHVGISHNSGLDEVKHVLHEYDQALTFESARALVESHYNELDPETAKNLVTYLIDTSVLSKTTANTELIDLLSDSLELYSRYSQVFDSIAVVLDMETSFNNKRLELEKIYLFIDNEANDLEDKDALMNGLSTTIHSLEYWEENYSEWQAILTDNMAKPALGLVGAVGIIDGAGAVVGTIEGFRDIPKGTDKRGRKIVGRAVGEGVKTSAFAVLSMVLL